MTYDGQNHDVCRQAFISMHGVGSDRVDYLTKKRQDITNTAISDQRGKGGHHNAVPKEDVEKVHMHILSLQVTASHYTRTINPHRQYLDFADKVSMNWIYVRYKEWLADNHPGSVPVKELLY